MTNRDSNSRRGALRQMGATLLGLLSWPVTRAFGKNPEGVFAGQFLQKGTTVQVPLGRYDPKTQVYVDAKTNKPVFTAEAVTEETKQLSEKELADLLKSGSFVNMMQLEKAEAFGGWCTLSRLTTLSTTSCCPIITDTSSDTQCDDTGPNPPPK